VDLPLDGNLKEMRDWPELPPLATQNYMHQQEIAVMATRKLCV
jgi:hypothetical protein